MGRNVVLVVVLVCVTAALGACGGSSPGATATTAAGGAQASTQPSTPAESSASPSGPAAIGEQRTAGPWEVQVTGVDVRPEAPGQVPPPAGKELMYVEVSLANTGSETLKITPQQFALTDSSGAAVKTFGKQQGYNAWGMTPLEPKYSTNTGMIYAVPPGSTGYTLTFTPTVNGQEIPLTFRVR